MDSSFGSIEVIYCTEAGCGYWLMLKAQRVALKAFGLKGRWQGGAGVPRRQSELVWSGLRYPELK